MVSRNYCIKEYGYFASDKYTRKVSGGNVLLPNSLFIKLERFLLKSKSTSKNNINQIMTIGYKRNIGKILQFNNYVGVIKTLDNITIEILTKIFMYEAYNGYKKRSKYF
ncbi:hypothetical protein FDF74_08720 [Clostridium niameyense]|uniref:Uncharacterized protein n=1 Tax=Clostridium niameyense TaxID=1622073 RepID=A0A6M0RAP6_9CLOT|nr:hypothetical protein [Clostridium niameyense]NEZ47286.1 hypothetical protein [Clostridium niameyense]